MGIPQDGHHPLFYHRDKKRRKEHRGERKFKSSPLCSLCLCVKKNQVPALHHIL
jgi:hypothetical protein